MWLKGCEDGSFWWNLTFFFILVQMIRLNLCNTRYLRLLEEVSCTLKRGSECPRQRGILRFKWNMNLTLPKPSAWRTQSNCKWGSCKPDALFIYRAWLAVGAGSMQVKVSNSQTSFQDNEWNRFYQKSWHLELQRPLLEARASLLVKLCCVSVPHSINIHE